jgi:hypothetical protein
VLPAGGWTRAEAANQDARVWSAEVNARVHSEIKVTPLERLEIERGVLRQLPSLRPPLRNGVPRKVARLSTRDSEVAAHVGHVFAQACPARCLAGTPARLANVHAGGL